MRNHELIKKVFAISTVSSVAIAMLLIAYFEGLLYKPYYDVAGVLTVCYGHTGSDIDLYKLYSESECNEFLEKDLLSVKSYVDPLITVEINEHTRAAIYSFVYNVGTGAFARSALLRKLNANDISGACDELKRWTFSGGKKWKGLINRRDTERAICNGSGE